MLPWTHQLSVVWAWPSGPATLTTICPASSAVSTALIYFTELRAAKVGSHKDIWPGYTTGCWGPALSIFRLPILGQLSWPPQIWGQVPWRNYKVNRGNPIPACGTSPQGCLAREAEWLLPLGMVCGQESPGCHISVCSPLISRELSSILTQGSQHLF